MNYSFRLQQDKQSFLFDTYVLLSMVKTFLYFKSHKKVYRANLMGFTILNGC